MRIAILHYHFKKGGVRTVVENACHSLNAHRYVALSGEPLLDAESDDARGTLPQCGVPVRVLPELAYWQADTDGPGLLERVKRAATEVLGGAPDLWHFHNHSLGKNATLPRLASALAAEGAPMLLQIHDFAEDGRPDNYRYLQDALGSSDADTLGAELYPLGARVHYAALNGRDASFLKAAGLPENRVHTLPNAVHIPTEPGLAAATGALAEFLGGRRLFLYPTRAIRRKNIGEFLLLARLGQLQAQSAEREVPVFAVTMAPGNPVERPIYERWVRLAQELELTVEWEFGARSGVPFAELLAGADHILTTSVGEGFGLAFLEPWLTGRPVAGRDLPEITRDFVEHGIRFPSLYEELPVSLESAGATLVAGLRTGFTQALNASYTAYGNPLNESELNAAWETAADAGYVDFAKLGEAGQEAVLRAPDELLEPLLPRLPWLDGTAADDTALVRENRAIIAREYSPEAYAQRLDALYQQVLAQPNAVAPESRSTVNGSRLLRCFLEPSRFTPLRGVR